MLKENKSISECLIDNNTKIESWFRVQWQKTEPPFYCSVDLRNAFFKLAPVDTNLFSAGFNNLNPDFLPLCVQAIQDAIGRVCLTARKVLIIPEEHTRNFHYLKNLATLRDILQHSGLEVRIGGLNIEETIIIELPFDNDNGIKKSITFEPLKIKDQHLAVDNFVPCVCLLNNDLSNGIPEILKKTKQSLFVPPLELGWSDRLKSDHFSHYKNVAKEFADYLNFDSWLIDPLFDKCQNVDFSTPEYSECLAENAGQLLQKIQKKYKEYGIKEKPFVLIKSDSGTYGMGIMIVHNAEELLSLNRKQRKKMLSNKGGSKITKVILQEGVYTFDVTSAGNACEPVVYMFDKDVVGGFYRVHKNKGVDENLNAPGMHFEPLKFDHSLIMPDKLKKSDAKPNQFYVYGVIARLAMLAAAREIAEVLD